MRSYGILLALVATSVSSQAPFTMVDSNYVAEPVAIGLSLPIAFEFLAPNDLLITEKNSGRVKRYTNGVLAGTVLDLAVNGTGERGLLGIKLDPDFAGNSYVYLYYCAADVDGGTYSGARVERYTWNGSALVSPQILWQISAEPGDYVGHLGGVLRFGPDGKLYVTVGEMGRLGKETNYETLGYCKAGGILRLNSDGTVPEDNPFVSHADPDFRKWFAYGIRNCFGMNFDRYTGRLWITDNGQTDFDEFNIVPAGMNGAWKDFDGPLARTGVGLGGLYMASGAQYVDPFFCWGPSLGIASMAFFDSGRFPVGSRDSLLVSDVNLENMYLMPVNANRDGFVVSGGNADGVADGATERDVFKWGVNWGVDTDMKIGPDGFMYVCALLDGKIMRVRPVSPLDQLRGHITLDTYVGIPASLPLKIEIRSGDTVVETHNTVVGAYRDYYISPGVTGTYDIWAKASNWLAIRMNGVTLTANTTLDLDFPVNGDAQQDNVIDVFDLNRIFVDFGGTSPDLDGNGFLDVFDMNLTLVHFGLVGEP